MNRLLKSRAHRGRRKAIIKRADDEAVLITCPQREEKGDNKERERMKRVYRSRARRGRRRPTIQRADARGYTKRGGRRATIKRANEGAIQIKGPQREDNGDNKESGDQGSAEG